MKHAPWVSYFGRWIDDLWTCTLVDVVHEWVEGLDSMHGSIGSCPHVVDPHPQPPTPPPHTHTQTTGMG